MPKRTQHDLNYTVIYINYDVIYINFTATRVSPSKRRRHVPPSINFFFCGGLEPVSES